MGALARLQKYGPTGIGTYLCISFCTWSCLFVAIENNLDVDGMVTYLWGEGLDTRAVLEWWGLKPADAGSKSILSKAPSAVLALVASKALVPIKIPLTMALTPYVHRFLCSRGILTR
jgi:hypothetical protein